jgi:hypothetical protein
MVMNNKKKPVIHLQHPMYPHLTVCGIGVKGEIVTVKSKNVTDIKCLGFRRMAMMAQKK